VGQPKVYNNNIASQRLPVRSDSRSARNDVQPRESKYSRHNLDPNGGIVTVASGGSRALPTISREDPHNASAQTPVDSRRNHLSTSVQPKAFPPRTSSLPRHGAQEGDTPQRRAQETSQKQLLGLEVRFTEISLANTTDCYKFVKAKPEILKSRPGDFLEEALYALRTGKDPYAKRCVARAILLKQCQDLSPRLRVDYFSGLRDTEGREFQDFHLKIKTALKKLEEKARQLGPLRPASEADPSLSSIRRPSIAPTNQVTRPVTSATIDRHGLPLDKPAQSKPPKPKPIPDDDDDDDDDTFGHNISSRHIMRGPEDDEEEDDKTFGHKAKLLSKAAKQDDSEPDYPDNPEFDPYGRHVDGAKRKDADAAERDVPRRRKQGGRGGVATGVSRKLTGDNDDDNDDDDDDTFGQKGIPLPTTYQDERRSTTYRDERRQNDGNATRDSRRSIITVDRIDSGPKRVPQSSQKPVKSNSEPIRISSSNDDSRHKSVR
jgi:hypothetical protein